MTRVSTLNLLHQTINRQVIPLIIFNDYTLWICGTTSSFINSIFIFKNASLIPRANEEFTHEITLGLVGMGQVLGENDEE